MIKNIKNEEFNKSGIYQIRNLLNNKIYIGSAYNLSDRFNCHKSLLKNNKHGNFYLQQSYNKYGAENFQFEVLEIIEEISKIYEIEQNYIDKFYGENCYNINRKTNDYKSLSKYNESRKRQFELVDSEGNRYQFSGYTETARLLGLNFRLLRNLIIGKSMSYKGWRLPENVDYDYKKYRSKNGRRAKLHNVSLISPTGDIYGPIYNIEEFCRNNNLRASNIRHIISGKNKSYKGWRLYTEKST